MDATVDYFWSWAKWSGTLVWLQLLLADFLNGPSLSAEGT